MSKKSFFVKTSEGRSQLLEKLKNKSLDQSNSKSIIGGLKWTDLGTWADNVQWPDRTWVDLG